MKMGRMIFALVHAFVRYYYCCCVSLFYERVKREQMWVFDEDDRVPSFSIVVVSVAVAIIFDMAVDKPHYMHGYFDHHFLYCPIYDPDGALQNAHVVNVI